MRSYILLAAAKTAKIDLFKHISRRIGGCSYSLISYLLRIGLCCIVLSVIVDESTVYGGVLDDGGQAKAFSQHDFSSCLVCHGAYAQGNPAVHAPGLRYLPPWYIQYQLESYQKGWRGTHPDDVSGSVMGAVAKLLTPSLTQAAVEAGKAWAKEFAASEVKEASKSGRDRSTSASGYARSSDLALTRTTSVGAPEGLVATSSTSDVSLTRGATLYAERCQSCHGVQKGRPEMRAPSLVWLDTWYLEAQLEGYKLGLRGYDPNDIYGQQMRGIAQALDTSMIRSLTLFLNDLRGNLR